MKIPRGPAAVKEEFLQYATEKIFWEGCRNDDT
ncbi:hypothetical protein J2S18_000549 [Eubacterium multiforme]|uniref:Uncharacterized protein n=1 Tax=Eubacterium multiforme TaxID=83339 RepID=A0ABT9UPQ6_9FIRM|nr:hypothetical protein [Eubacterium multiforme]